MNVDPPKSLFKRKGMMMRFLDIIIMGLLCLRGVYDVPSAGKCVQGVEGLEKRCGAVCDDDHRGV